MLELKATDGITGTLKGYPVMNSTEQLTGIQHLSIPAGDDDSSMFSAFGNYITTTDEPAGRIVNEVKKLFADIVRDTFLENAELVVRGPDENGLYTIGYGMYLRTKN